MAIDVQSIWLQVKTNHRLLEACPRHKFSATEVKMGQKLECEVCHGKMRLTDIGNYIRGYRAAGKSPSDIWPAWK
jgi:hypothetical protein